jgi:hypothetical protein
MHIPFQHLSRYNILSNTFNGALVVPKLNALTVRNPSFCIYEFCMILSEIRDHFLKQHLPDDLCNGEVLCPLGGTG